MGDKPRVVKSSNRGSKPGERRGGRVKGVPNKATAEIKTIARQYTGQAIATLAEIMVNGQSEAARVAAVNALLDRAYGKPSQVVAGDPENPLRMIAKVELVGVRPK